MQNYLVECAYNSKDDLGALSEAEEMVVNTQADSLYVLKKDLLFEDSVESDDETIKAVASNVNVNIKSYLSLIHI